MKTTAQLFLRVLPVLLGIGLSLPAAAEDIDIYSDNPRTTDVPNVLFILDNAANFSSSAASCTYDDDGTAPSLNGTAGGIEQCALYNVVNSLPDGAVNLGIMIYDSTGIRDWRGANCGQREGACLAVPLTLMSGALKTEFLAWVRSWQTSSSGPGSYWVKANGESTGAAVAEAWAYYAGKVGLSGRNYGASQPPAGCQKNFVIFIGNALDSNGSPGEGGSSSPGAALAQAMGVGTTTDVLTATNITIPSGSYGTTGFSCGTYTMPLHTESSGLYADEWARFMRTGDLYPETILEGQQAIVTYTIGVLSPSCKPSYPALLNSMATHGGGKYFATTDYSEISTAILKILNEVQAVNSVFASASLPVSVNAQGTYLNQIFLGMFRPDSSGAPRWLGNLKQYQFIMEYLDPNNPDPNTAILKLGDALGNPALSTAGTGFITPTAVSFWTSRDDTKAPDSTGGFFFNDARGAGGGYDLPDGELVEKGGVAQLIRSKVLTVDYPTQPDTPRRLYTYCPTAVGNDGITLDFGAASCNQDLTATANMFSVSNAELTNERLQAVAKQSVTRISRRGNTVTVQTASAHRFAVGDWVTVTGADQPEYNGNKLVTSLPGGSTTAFTFSVVENPPTYVDGVAGGWTASVPSITAQAVQAINRVGSTATVTLPGHGYVTGESLVVSGANEKAYNGRFTITRIDADHFSYQVVESPPLLGGGGTATVGTTTAFIDNITAKIPGVQRGVWVDPVTGKADPLKVLITFTQWQKFQKGNTVVLSGILNAAGNPVPGYELTTPVLEVFGPNARNVNQIVVAIPATTPPTPATGTIVVDRNAAFANITRIDRTVGVGTAVVTAPGHPFYQGQPVDIAASVLGAGEGAYVGHYTISLDLVDPANKFTYTVTTSPVTPATTSSYMEAWKTGVSDRVSLINWLRGENNFGDEPQPGFGYTVRQSVHGDVLHSRPVVVNYGDTTRGLVIFYGANDGVFRAVNGSQTAAIGTVPPGGELWSMILPEHYAKLNRQRVNAPEVKMPQTALPSARPKDYFVDGATGTYQQLDSNGNVAKAYLYLTMRRGGGIIYAIDVTDPVQPKVMWRLDANTPGFAEMAQSWSRPRVTVVAGYPDPVLVFGAGYDDSAEDVEPPVAGTRGRGLFVLDAATGALIWRATSSADTSTCPPTAVCHSVSGMNWSIPADPRFVDRDNDGKTERFYMSDVGGNVWRVDLEPLTGSAPSNWNVTQLAAVGCDTGACAIGTTPRKFFFPPSVVPVGTTGAADAYDVVLIGSGDREHPLIDTVNPQSSYNVMNRFYALKDTRTGKDASVNMSGYPITEAMLYDATTTVDATTGQFVANPYPGTGSGYYVSLMGYDNGDPLAQPPVPPAAHRGEKVVNAPLTTRGTTFFGTNTPVPPGPKVCTSNLGQAKGYALDPFGGGFSSTIYDGGGMPPSAVTGVVRMRTPDGKEVNQTFCVGCGGLGGTTADDKSSTGGRNLSQTVPKRPRRTYWYKR